MCPPKMVRTHSLAAEAVGGNMYLDNTMLTCFEKKKLVLTVERKGREDWDTDLGVRG